MTKNQKIFLTVGAVGLLAYFYFRSTRATSFPTKSPIRLQCEEEYLVANHPDVVRTPEEQEKYKNEWIVDCVFKKEVAPV